MNEREKEPIAGSALLRAMHRPAVWLAKRIRLEIPAVACLALCKRLRLSGERRSVSPSEVVFLAIVASLTITLAVFLARGFVADVFTLTFLASGPLLVCQWLGSSIAERKRSVRKHIMNALDLLAISVEAGMDFSQAMAVITSSMPNSALREIFLEFVECMQKGLSRRECLESIADASDERSFKDMTDTLIRAERLGTGISGALRRASRMLREEEFARAERAGVVAAQKALIPLVICIMPATFIVVFGPLVTRIYYGGLEGLLGI